MFEQNNRSWAESDMVIYRTWRVDAMHDLHPSALWPRELEAVIVGVAIVKEVVADANEMM
jgi:hypothetical protein